MALHRDHPKQQSARLWRGHRRGWAALLLALTLSTTLVKENATNLQLSLLTVPQHAPFDGTVMPIQQVPNWLEATDDERKLVYNAFPQEKLIASPTYDPSRLREDLTQLEWGDPYDDHTREMIITYPVPYAGTYQFDGIEGLGSHPGVDIKALKGTPVYAIANGVAEKVSYSNGGFGNHIVLRHDEVPDFKDSTQLTTLHSGYAHLNEIFIEDGEVVTKGQLIGAVGDTGTATTDHLHFQIDNAKAPWHLYWPFTTAEANEAGGFWEAINKGVGQDKLYQNTVNPLEYVEKYADPNAVYEAAPEVATETTPEVVTETVVEALPPTSTLSGLPFSKVNLDYDPYVFLNGQQEATLSIMDDLGELVKNAALNSPLKVTVEDPTVLRVTPSEFTQNSLRNGQAPVSLIPLKVGRTDFTVSFLGKPYFSGEVIVPSDREPLESFALETDHQFTLGQPEPVVVVALNKNG